MSLLASKPGWFGWAGSTLNLGMIRLTCPHLLGPAHNCNDLFLLSEPNRMPSISPPNSFVFLSLPIVTTVLFPFWLNQNKVQIYKCAHRHEPNLCALFVRVFILLQYAWVLPAFWPRQPINTTMCLGVRCLGPPAMASSPKDLHRPMAAGGPARPTVHSLTMNLSVTCQPLLAVLLQPSQESLTSSGFWHVFCCWDFIKIELKQFFLHSVDHEKRCYLQEAEF